MRAKRCVALIVLLYSLALVPRVFADTYPTFQTTRYYSKNRHYVVIVTKEKHATLYQNRRGLRRVWSRTLPELPRKLLVTNDGKRIAIVDRYYGNGGFPETPVVIIIGENGEKISSHSLGEVTNLRRVVQTVSAVHWYSEARLAPDGEVLIIETIATKRDWDECLRTLPSDEWEKCWETVPYQQLRFSLSSGELVERVSLASK